MGPVATALGQLRQVTMYLLSAMPDGGDLATWPIVGPPAIVTIWHDENDGSADSFKGQLIVPAAWVGLAPPFYGIEFQGRGLTAGPFAYLDPGKGNAMVAGQEVNLSFAMGQDV